MKRSNIFASLVCLLVLLGLIPGVTAMNAEGSPTTGSSALTIYTSENVENKVFDKTLTVLTFDPYPERTSALQYVTISVEGEKTTMAAGTQAQLSGLSVTFEGMQSDATSASAALIGKFIIEQVASVQRPIIIALSEDAPTSDVALGIDLTTELSDAGFLSTDASAPKVARSFTEITRTELDSSITVAIYRSKVFIITPVNDINGDFKEAMTFIDEHFQAKGMEASIISSSEVSAINTLFGEEPVSQEGTYWTQWYNRDDPSGSGDWELKFAFPDVCLAPIDIECQPTDAAATAAQDVICTTMEGLACENSKNPQGCYDYKIRFLCQQDENAPELKIGKTLKMPVRSEALLETDDDAHVVIQLGAINKGVADVDILTTYAYEQYMAMTDRTFGASVDENRFYLSRNQSKVMADGNVLRLIDIDGTSATFRLSEDETTPPQAIPNVSILMDDRVVSGQKLDVFVVNNAKTPIYYYIGCELPFTIYKSNSNIVQLYDPQYQCKMATRVDELASGGKILLGTWDTTEFVTQDSDISVQQGKKAVPTGRYRLVFQYMTDPQSKTYLTVSDSVVITAAGLTRNISDNESGYTEVCADGCKEVADGCLCPKLRIQIVKTEDGSSELVTASDARNADNAPHIESLMIKPGVRMINAQIRNGAALQSQVIEAEEKIDLPFGDSSIISVGSEAEHTRIYSNSVTATTKEDIIYKDKKLYLKSNAAIEVMPDSANAQFIEYAAVNPDQITLVEQNGEPVYIVSGQKDVKILGMFTKSMPLKATVSAQDGEIDVDKPWYSAISTQ